MVCMNYKNKHMTLLMPGTATTNGHYTAMIKKGDHWWDMNDYSVTRTDPSKALKSKENYMLFYVAQ